MLLPEWKKILILIVGLLEILIFSGTILGWASLKLMLLKEKIYFNKCSNVTNISASNISAIESLSQFPSTTRIPPFLTSENIISSTQPPLKINETIFDIIPTTPTTRSSSMNWTTNEIFDQQPQESKSISLPLLSQVSLKLDLTVSAVGNGSFQDNGQSVKSIVIPFEANQSLDSNLIYELVNSGTGLRLSTDSKSRSLISNRTSSASSFFSEIRLFPRFIHPLNGRNLSTLEELLNLYLSESAENQAPHEELEKNSCREQEDALNLAYAIGSFCMGAAAFIWGFLLEKWGLRIVRLVINFMISFGAFLMCFVAPGQDWILFPAVFIMSLGGVPIRIANMQFSNLYPTKRSTIIAVYSGAFSASSIIYVFIELIYKQLTISFFWVNFILVILSLFMIPFTLFILPKDKIHDQHESIKNDAKEQIPKVLDKNGNDVLQFDSKPHFLSQNITLQNYKEVQSPNLCRKITNIEGKNAGFDNEAYVNDEEQNNYDSAIPVQIHEKFTSTHIQPNSPPLGLSLYSIPYNLHQIWFSWMITYMLLYVGSLSGWTKQVTNDPVKQGDFVKLYGFVQVLALVISPLAGLLMDYKLAQANLVQDPLKRKIKRVQSGFWPLFITTGTLLICVICQFFNSQEFIYISIVFITIYRAFLLAVGSAFLRVRFHGDHFNRLLGIMSSVSAFASLIQIGLLKWESLYANIVSLIFALIVMSNPLYLLFTPLQKYFIRKEEESLKKYT